MSAGGRLRAPGAAAAPGRPLRLALLGDYPEEGWPSMDLVGAMIAAQLRADWADEVAVTPACPPFRRRASRGPRRPAAGARHNLDRLLNRFHDYPRSLRRWVARDRFDLYHLVDHSYSQLVHALPPGRVVVTCHDLDTFRCILEPAREPRPRWFRAMARRILDGLVRAAAVVCDSQATRAAILRHGLLPPGRLHVVPLGIDATCRAEPEEPADAAAAAVLGPADPDGPPELLHVGSTIPRKRIDVLLHTLAAVRRAFPGARLIKASADLTAAQWDLARSLGVADAVVVTGPLERPVLAAVYRRAALVLQPSDAEGFGLPVAEALACGTPVLASDLDVLREVGADVASYAPAGDLTAWSEATLSLLSERRDDPSAWSARRSAGLAHAAAFRWDAHAARLVAIYRSLLS